MQYCFFFCQDFLLLLFGPGIPDILDSQFHLPTTFPHLDFFLAHHSRFFSLSGAPLFPHKNLSLFLNCRMSKNAKLQHCFVAKHGLLFRGTPLDFRATKQERERKNSRRVLWERERGALLPLLKALFSKEKHFRCKRLLARGLASAFIELSYLVRGWLGLFKATAMSGERSQNMMGNNSRTLDTKVASPGIAVVRYRYPRCIIMVPFT